MRRVLLAGFCVAAFSAMVGCEWGSDDGYNTSQGIALNFSGVYHGELAGGKIVDGTDITRFTMTQAGNTLQVWDSQGSYYEGNVGSPGLVSQPIAAGVYPRGAELVQAQISMSGTTSAGAEVQFVGVIHAVAVEDIKSTEIISGSTSSTSSNTTFTAQSANQQGSLVIDNSSSSSSSAGQVIGSRYTVQGANTRYVLEGQWIAAGGTAYVKGSSAATYGIIEILNGEPPEITGDGDFTVNAGDSSVGGGSLDTGATAN